MVRKITAYELIDLIRENKDKTYYLEEDCIGVSGGGFKRLKELSDADVKKLATLGYHILWIWDGEEFKGLYKPDEKQRQFTRNYLKKYEEMEANLTKCLMIVEEQEIHKSGSSIKIFEGDDLTKQTINALQNEGAGIILKNNFGDKARKIIGFRELLENIIKNPPDKIALFENISFGETLKKQEDIDEVERTNFYLKTMINTGLLMAAVSGKIQKKRIIKSNSPEEEMRHPHPDKRPIYFPKVLVDASMGATFTDYGFVHAVIDRCMMRNKKDLMDVNGKMIGSGEVDLGEGDRHILDRHCNVGMHILSSQKEPPLIGETGKKVIQYHHRCLNGNGYPKRKTLDERVGVKIGDSMHYEVRNLYESDIPELVRLAGIINSFIEYLFGTPYRLPFERDSLCRYFMLNVCYPLNEEGNDDTKGIFDLKTREKYTKRFDGYLVDEFLKSIILFKIGEEIPIYSFENPDKLIYHGVVAGYTDYPHRPIIRVQEKGAYKTLDLSKDEHKNLFIGEYHPALKFRKVMESIDQAYRMWGVEVPEDQIMEESVAGEAKRRKSKEDMLKEAEIDNIFDQGSQKLPGEEGASDDFDLDAFLNSTMPSTIKGNKAGEQPAEATEASSPTQEIEQFESLDETTNETIDETTEETTIVEEAVIEPSDTPQEEKTTQIMDQTYEDPDLPPLTNEELNWEIEDMLQQIDCIKNNIKIPYGIGKTTDQGVILYYTARLLESDGPVLKYAYERLTKPTSPIPLKENNTSSGGILLEPGKQITRNELEDPKSLTTLQENYSVGDYFLMNYVKEWDPKKNPNPPQGEEARQYKGEVRYLVEILEKTDNPERPKIIIIRYIKDNEGELQALKDKNCGQTFDLRRLTTFRLDQKLSASKLAQILKLKLK